MAYKGEPYCGVSHVSKFFSSQSELDVAAAAEYRRRVEAYEGKAPPRAIDAADFLECMRRRAEDLHLATLALEHCHPPIVVEAGRFPPAEHRAPGDTRLRREAAARARLAGRPDPPLTTIRKAGRGLPRKPLRECLFFGPQDLILDHCFGHIPGRRARFWEAVRALAWWLDDLAGVKLGRIISKKQWAGVWRKPRRECP